MQTEEIDLATRTKSFALQMIQLFSTLPKTTEAQVLGKQVLRSGTLVGANYREAYRGRSKAEFIARYELRPEERQALLGPQWRRLIDLGVLPNLMYRYYALHGLAPKPEDAAAIETQPDAGPRALRVDLCAHMRAKHGLAN